MNYVGLKKLKKKKEFQSFGDTSAHLFLAWSTLVKNPKRQITHQSLPIFKEFEALLYWH